MERSLQSVSGRTFPESCQPKTMPSGASSGLWSELMRRSTPQGAGGLKLVALKGRRGEPLGGCLTLNSSDSPSDARGCSLLQVLETGSIPQRYFLSSRACAGVLRRAKRVGRELPEVLRIALEQTVARGGRLVVLNDPGSSSIQVEAAGLSPTLTAQHHGHQPCVVPCWCRPDKNSRPVDVSTTLDRNCVSPTAYQGGNARADYHPSGISATLDRNGADIRVGRFGGTAIVQTVAPQPHGASMKEDDKAGTLRSRCVFMGGGDAALAVVNTVYVQGYGAMREDDKANTLRANRCFAPGGDSALAIESGAEQQFAVRRLTVTECERLMGFPDGYTRISYHGRPAEDCPDTPRYTALGNSWAVPVVRWVGERIQMQMREANCGHPVEAHRNQEEE